MQQLPTLIVGESDLRLPLSDQTAIRLAEGLLTDDEIRRVDELSIAIREDPILAVWVVWQRQILAAANPEDSTSSLSLAALAEWLGHNALQILDVPREDTSKRQPLCESKRWANFVYRSILTASESADLVKGDDDKQSAYLLGLLRDHRHCIELAGVNQSDVSAVDCSFELAIQSISEGMSATCSVAGASRPQSDVVESDAPSPSGSAKTKAKSVFSNSENHRHAWKTARNWQEYIPGAARVLQLVVVQLVRQSKLQDRFAAAVEQEKLAALKEFAYGASHEINNPLANISTRAQTLLRDEVDEERRRKLATINAQAFRAHEMISDLMLFAKPPRLHVEEIDSTAIIDKAIKELTPVAESQGTTLIRTGDDRPFMIDADREQLAVALKAVGDNALEALGIGGSVKFSTNQLSGADGKSVEIVVTDTGPGITPEARRHLFDPFYSGREAGRGLGFGLSKCWRIVTEHGGTIQVESNLGEGSTFRLRLPIKSPHSQSKRAA